MLLHQHLGSLPSHPPRALVAAAQDLGPAHSHLVVEGVEVEGSDPHNSQYLAKALPVQVLVVVLNHQVPHKIICIFTEQNVLGDGQFCHPKR